MNEADMIDTELLMRDILSEDFHTRWFAAEVIGTKRDLSPDQLNILRDIAKTSDVGEVLLWGLGMMRAEGVEDFIGTFLEHENNYFRWRAAEALRDIGSPSAIRILTSMLNGSEEIETRWKCAWALGEIGNISSFDTLWRAAEYDDDRYVRWKSIWGITRLHGNIEEILIEKLTSSDKMSDFMAWRATWALGMIGDSRAIDMLLQIKKSYIDSKYVNYQIALSVEAIKKRIKKQ